VRGRRGHRASPSGNRRPAARCAAGSGAAATAELALAELDGGAAFGLLLSDIALGAGLRGTQLAQLAQTTRPELAVLLMSGYSSELLDADEASAWGSELARQEQERDARWLAEPGRLTWVPWQADGLQPVLRDVARALGGPQGLRLFDQIQAL